jgi:GMP synthase (glutamine-hydrolysing)
LQLNEEGKKLFKTDRDVILLNEFHQDHVSVLPKGFKTLAFTEENTPNQITVSENKQCMTVQGHPEFNRDTVTSLIHITNELGLFKDGFAKQCLDTLKHEPDMDDVWLTERIIDFILDA